MEKRMQEIGNSRPHVWAVAVFAAREKPAELYRTVQAIDAAAAEHTVIDVMVNGNAGLATEVSRLINLGRSSNASTVIRVWSIFLGDKAHTWNQYVHHVWPGAKQTFFVDGYVRVRPDALKLLDAGMSAAPYALGGTGVPTAGRTASAAGKRMLTEGGIHGNLFALTNLVMLQLRQKKFHLPLGIYRTDGTLGAALAFGLDPSKNGWDLKRRILVHPSVSWATDEKTWWRYSEIKSQFKRILRQAQGELENCAVKDLLAGRRIAPEMLPHTASEMVLDWVRLHPNEVQGALLKNPLVWFALKKLREPRDWSAEAQLPQLISTIQ